MQPNPFPFGTVLGNPLLFSGDLSTGGGGGSRAFVFQGDGMDLSKVGEKILRSVRSARSLGLLPSTSDRPDSRGSEQQQQQQLLLVLLQDCLLIRGSVYHQVLKN
ncbi:hypothetical protein LWI28_022449 [Acer negundo]|uniref:Uncharacterized protein n=1 Tax=Acer negundo TaxID=4023 RepID=A0AAD5P1I6_ACENE|nr:hypothetical protein LWI28_022449 [Acer negundo]